MITKLGLVFTLVIFTSACSVLKELNLVSEEGKSIRAKLDLNSSRFVLLNQDSLECKSLSSIQLMKNINNDRKEQMPIYRKFVIEEVEEFYLNSNDQSILGLSGVRVGNAPDWFVNSYLRKHYKGKVYLFFIDKEPFIFNDKDQIIADVLFPGGLKSERCKNSQVTFLSWDEQTSNLFKNKRDGMQQIQNEIREKWLKENSDISVLQIRKFKEWEREALRHRKENPVLFEKCRTNGDNLKEKVSALQKGASGLAKKELDQKLRSGLDGVTRFQSACGQFSYPSLSQVKSTCSQVWQFYKKGIERMQGSDRCLLRD